MASEERLSSRCRIRLALLAAFAAGAAPAGAAISAKTLSRVHDPVIVRTSLLDSAADRRTEHYRLYSDLSGELAPIPFEFDRRDDHDELVLNDADDAHDFDFDDNDELVFMAKDSGDRVPPDVIPGDGALEIEIVDPADGGRGWVYLAHFDGRPPAPSTVRYATFDAARNQVRALFYEVDYAEGRNYFTGIRISAAGGGSGENLVDRMRIRVNPTFSLLLTTWSPEFDEDSFTVKIDGVQNGPVRAVRRVRQSLDIGGYFPQIPSGITYTYYYFSSFVTPSKFRVPWLALKSLRDFRFAGVSDLGDRARDIYYWDGANPQGVRLDGEAPLNVETANDHDWYVLSSPAGTCLHAFFIPEKWRRWGIVRGTALHSSEWGPTSDGSWGDLGGHFAGYSLAHMTNLREPGAYDMSADVIILPRGYRPGDEARPLAMFKQPLQVGVRPAADPRAAAGGRAP